MEKQTMTTENMEVSTNLDSDVSAAAPVKPKDKKRQYNSRNRSEKIDLLRLIVSKFGVAPTRQNLLSIVNNDEGRSWLAFQFITNDKGVKTYANGKPANRGVYLLDNLTGFEGVASKLADQLGSKTE